MQEHIIQYVLQPRYPIGIMMESQKFLENCQFYEVFEEGGGGSYWPGRTGKIV